MGEWSRRRFLQAGAAASAAAALAACSDSKNPSTASGSDTASGPAPPAAKGKLTDVEHVVIFIQENRSFDQYFGTRQRVRGFDDPKVPKGASGKPAWYQPSPENPDGFVLPFRFDSLTTSGQCAADIDHSWEGQHAAWNGGHNDGFAQRMGTNALGYFTAQDLPYYGALADRYTVCDGYHCSVLGPTNPNRLFAFTGNIDAGGQHEGPVIDNTTKPFTWETYAERLQRAGVSWRVYHEADDFDDNTIKFFKSFLDLKPTDDLYVNALQNRTVADFASDVAAGDLPQVSWLVAPTALSEHPPFAPAAGQNLTAQYLAALFANPKVWAKTVFIYTTDENGGYFDHVPPPVPDAGAKDEFVRDLPIGLGFRVPTLVVSPWSAGGKVVSDVFDHTSTLQFLEKRFGVEVPYVSPWRRRTVGDLTTTLDFATFDASVPRLPDAAAWATKVAATCSTLPPAAPPTKQVKPKQG